MVKPVSFPQAKNNPHAEKITSHFGGLKYEFASLPAATSFVFLCFTNRCGSNYLAELIASSGQYNAAGEVLNWETVIDHSERRGFASFQQYFEFLVRHLRKSERVFIKTAVPHLDLIARSGILDQIMPRSSFVLIERADKLAQAISFALAFATGKFTSLMSGSKSPEEVEFSATHIDNIISNLAEQYKEFDIFFGRNGIVPFVLVYEQLIAEPSLHINAMARHLGLPAISVNQDAVRIKRQSGEINLQWRERYLNQ